MVAFAVAFKDVAEARRFGSNIGRNASRCWQSARLFRLLEALNGLHMAPLGVTGQARRCSPSLSRVEQRAPFATEFQPRADFDVSVPLGFREGLERLFRREFSQGRLFRLCPCFRNWPHVPR